MLSSQAPRYLSTERMAVGSSSFEFFCLDRKACRDQAVPVNRKVSTHAPLYRRKQRHRILVKQVDSAVLKTIQNNSHTTGFTRRVRSNYAMYLSKFRSFSSLSRYCAHKYTEDKYTEDQSPCTKEKSMPFYVPLVQSNFPLES